jgi:phosphinothricin acetyltransferase
MPAQIRLAGDADAEPVTAIYAHYVQNTAISFELQPPSAGEMGQRIRETLAALPWLVCENGSAILGYAYAAKHRDRPAYMWSTDVSIYIRHDLHRQGLGRGLYASLFALLQLQGFYNLFAGITLPNDASYGLHRALGFEPIGVYRSVGFKMGRWHDVVWLGMTLRLHEPSPTPVIRLADVIDTPEAQAALAAGAALVKLR